MCSSRERSVLGSARCSSGWSVSSIDWVRASRSAAISASSTQTALMLVVPGGQVSDAGVLPGPDAVFDAGVRTVPTSWNASCPRSVWVVKA